MPSLSMNEEFVQHALSNGVEGALWLQRIPEIIAAYETKWSFLSPPLLLNQSSSMAIYIMIMCFHLRELDGLLSIQRGLQQNRPMKQPLCFAIPEANCSSIQN